MTIASRIAVLVEHQVAVPGHQEPGTSTLRDFAVAETTYDARGQAVLVEHPDGSQDRKVHGIPVDLSDPDHYVPTPWETYSYDANDNAGRTQPIQAAGYSAHWNTPTSMVIDALGRTTSTTTRLVDTSVTIRSEYDIQGRIVRVTDAGGRVTSTAVYDVAGRSWTSFLLDAGPTTTVYDANGEVIEHRDAKGALQLQARDGLHRPMRLWARDNQQAATTLREAAIYGDQAGLPNPQADNLCGKPYFAYDEAGAVSTPAYDLAGHLRTSTRQVLSAAALLSTTSDAYTVDWTIAFGTDPAPAAALLDVTPYVLDQAWDALGRRTVVLSPADDSGHRHRLEASYSRAGALSGVRLDGTAFVTMIVHNARGQRVAALHGNGVLTRYAHDPATFRLQRQRSEQVAAGQPGVWTSVATPLADTGYNYDLVGNTLTLSERAPGSGVPGATPDTLDRTFAYDARYRLTSATGREHKDPLPDLWSAAPRGSDATATQTYTEQYDYDIADNVTTIVHRAGSAGYTRNMDPIPGSNQLASLTTGGNSFAYLYDSGGNMTAEASSRHFGWDARNRLVSFKVQPEGAQIPSISAQYRYDPAGERVLKLLQKQSGPLTITVYPGGLLERTIVVNPAGNAEKYDELHISDSTSKIAVVRLRPMPNDQRPAVGYQLTDHLGSSCAVVDNAGNLVNREEYLPYGETAFGSYTLKRYRFTGKECDSESGLSYHGARYYAPWLGRWRSADPDGLRDGLNLYSYCGNNPVCYLDPSGRAGESLQKLILPHQFNGAESTQQIHEFTRGQGYDFQGSPTWQEGTKQWDVGALTPIAKSAGGASSPGASPGGFWTSIVSGREEAAFGKSLIPMIGSVQNANYHFGQGNWARGTLYTAAAISDVFLLRSLITGAIRTGAKGMASLGGVANTIIKELAPTSGVGSGTKFGTRLGRLLIQDLSSYKASSSVVYRILRQHLQIMTRNGSRSMFEMHHWAIQHAWYDGNHAAGGIKSLLQKFGDAGWNLIPIPGPVNNALGKSSLATISFAHKLASTIWHEVLWASKPFRDLYSSS